MATSRSTLGELPTAKDYAGIHTVFAVCRDPACDRWAKLDLAALVAAGQGDIPLITNPASVALQRVRQDRTRNKSQRP
jgi:hypothetical protein